ncbi:MAG: protein phosphatase 1 regulatory subunit 42, partial [Deltaproteobacteria bacterium]|nr:protein phosphatase 1 regulatory subunit 42 [Deltaproteobacteria bacterium]
APGKEGGGAARGTPSVTGVWQISHEGCRQTLSLNRDGTFRLGATVRAGGRFGSESVDGVYTPGAVLSDGRPTYVFQPSTPVGVGHLIYCDQWTNRVQATLAYPAVQSTYGFSPAGLAYRGEGAAGLDRVLIGTDSLNRDRFVYYIRNGSVLKGVSVDSLSLPGSLYAALPGDANRQLFLLGGVNVVNLPEDKVSATVNTASAGSLATTFVLNLTSATRATFAIGPQTPSPVCHFEVYTDLTFSTIQPGILNTGMASQVWLLNPLDGTQFYFNQTVGTPPNAKTAYLLPVAVVSNQPGTCQYSVTGEGGLGSLLAATPQLDTLAVISSKGGEWPGFMGADGAAPIRLSNPSFDPLALSLMFSGLPDQMVSIPRATPGSAAGMDYDLLGLTGALPRPVTMDVVGGAVPSLNLASTVAGVNSMGSFVPAQNRTPAATLGVGATQIVGFPLGGETRRFTLQVGAAGRVAAWSEGGLDTRASLWGQDGIPLAGDDGGGLDGLGFYMERTLAAGNYVLEVTSLGAGTVTLKTASGTASAYGDENLEGCLVAHGLLRGAVLGRLSCSRQAIRSLTGLGVHSGLTHLDVSLNRLTDLTPLTALVNLRSLSLTGNQVADPTPLSGTTPGGGLPRLVNLSLAGNPLDPAKLVNLQNMQATLSYLDLTLATGITPADVTSLKTFMPSTIIIGLDGRVVP